MFLQVALSKSASDIDNFEFEMGSTCVTVDGAGQSMADEVFMRVSKWIEARAKPHSFMPVHDFYKKHEWAIDQLAVTLFPFLIVLVSAVYSLKQDDLKFQVALIPLIIAIFSIANRMGGKINSKMGRWAAKSRSISLFLMTNGDVDAVAKNAALAKNSSIKLIVTNVISFALNIFAGLVAWWLTK